MSEPPTYLWRFEAPLVAARFVERPHRFALVCARESDGATLQCHMADPGRLKEILVPGARVWLRGPFGPPRKLPWSAVLAQEGGVRVSLVTTLANTLFPSLLERGLWPALRVPAGATLRREVKHGDSRVDFAIEQGQRQHLIEVKSVTLCRGEGAGAFPDAPSQRARKHLEALMAHVRAGGRASVVFVGARGDLEQVEAARDIDPAFAELLEEADEAGVALLAARVTLDEQGARDPVAIPVRV